jgi:hypothetical protein
VGPPPPHAGGYAQSPAYGALPPGAYADNSEHAAQMTAAAQFNPASFDAEALRAEILGEKKDGSKKKKRPKEGQLRFAGGESWIDDKMDFWAPNDFRIFVGNLGPEVRKAVGLGLLHGDNLHHAVM